MSLYAGVKLPAIVLDIVYVVSMREYHTRVDGEFQKGRVWFNVILNLSAFPRKIFYQILQMNNSIISNGHSN